VVPPLIAIGRPVQTTIRPVGTTVPPGDRQGVGTGALSPATPAAPPPSSGGGQADRPDALAAGPTTTTAASSATSSTVRVVSVPAANGPFDSSRLPERPVVHHVTSTVTQVDTVPRRAERLEDGATISFRFLGTGERISVQLNGDRMPALWIVWLAIAMLLMALWLPGSGSRASRH
jgi:hypothetical protein